MRHILWYCGVKNVFFFLFYLYVPKIWIYKINFPNSFDLCNTSTFSQLLSRTTKISHAEPKEYPSYWDAINVRRFTYFVVHPRARSPIFHHFKAQFASARSTILPVVAPTTNSSFLPFLFLPFLSRAPSSGTGSDNPRQP